MKPKERMTDKKKHTHCFRNGYPTKKYLIELIMEFWKDGRSPWPAQCYGRHKGFYWLTWTDTKINDRMKDFVLFLNNKGIYTGTLRPYNSPTTGQLTLKPL